MVKDNVVRATFARLAKVATLGFKTGAFLSVGLVATAQVSQAQTVYYRNSGGQATTTERDYSYSTWATSSFIGSGYIQSEANQNQAYAYWKYTRGGFQVAKGLRAIPEGPDQLWYVSVNDMVYTDGKGIATFDQRLNVRSIAPGAQIWTGVQGWLQGIEYYVVENLDRGALGIPESAKVGSVTIDGAAYDLYTRPYNTWRQWWSVRRVKRTSGTVNYVKHFKAWQGVTVPGVTNLVNNAATKLPNLSLLSVSLGVETYGPSEASIWWQTSSITKPYN
ncbi:MAG: glycoside hydrolase family 11 protein [Akkermansiaceae bacterium]|nr:glycoside hydrolase family 11 protein [Armatimonadota bacterium]